MKFRTNAKCGGCTAAIMKALSSLAPEDSWTFDLSSPDKTLTYIGADKLSEAEIVKAVESAGFQAVPLS